MSPSINNDDDLDKRSALREVSRSGSRNRHKNDITSHQSQTHRENMFLQISNSKYHQPRPCSSMYTDADSSYLRNSFLPMTIPRGGGISNYPSLHEAARWQQAATATTQYVSYYQHFSPETTSDLKSETERYMERLIGRERVQADGYGLRCAMDKPTLVQIPNFGGRRVPDSLTSSTAGIVAYPRPEDALGPTPASPWQRQIVSGAVFPLSSSMIDLPSENWCAKCNASFRMTSDLVYHMRTHHKCSGVEESECKKREKKLKCSICNETFCERHHLTRHMTSHVNTCTWETLNIMIKVDSSPFVKCSALTKHHNSRCW